jgi:hypothetical protein
MVRKHKQRGFKMAELAKKIGNKRNRTIGVLILALVVVALFAIISTIPQKAIAQTGAVIAVGAGEQSSVEAGQLDNVTKPSTTLRVIYTKS